VELPSKKTQKQTCLQNPGKIEATEQKQDKLFMDPKQVNYRPLQQ